MSTTLTYNVVDMIEMDASIAGTVNTQVADQMNQSNYDAALYFAGDFLTGNYKQDPGDVNSVCSNLVFSQSGINDAYAFLLKESYR